MSRSLDLHLLQDVSAAQATVSPVSALVRRSVVRYGYVDFVLNSALADHISLGRIAACIQFLESEATLHKPTIEKDN
jgi:hypothetical protein